MFALQEQILDTIEQFMHYCWQLGLFEYKHDLDFSLGSLQSHVMRWTPFSDYECILWLWNQSVSGYSLPRYFGRNQVCTAEQIISVFIVYEYAKLLHGLCIFIELYLKMKTIIWMQWLNNVKNENTFIDFLFYSFFRNHHHCSNNPLVKLYSSWLVLS